MRPGPPPRGARAIVRAGSRVDEPSRLRSKVAGIGPPPLIRRPSSTNPFNSRRAVLCSFVLSTPPWGTSVWATVSLDSWATSDSRCTRLVQAVETAAGRLSVQGTSLGWRLVTLERSAPHGLGPLGQSVLECGPVQCDEHLADDTELGRGSGEPETMHEGAVVINGPLGDGGGAARRT